MSSAKSLANRRERAGKPNLADDVAVPPGSQIQEGAPLLPVEWLDGMPLLPVNRIDEDATLPRVEWLDGLPILYEDEGFEEMGDAAPHTEAIQILLAGINSHFGNRPDIQVFSDLDLYYHPSNLRAYISPDLMVVVPYQRMAAATSYRIDKDGPAPLLAIEVLSPRTGQQRDLGEKAALYSSLKVAEYVLVDPRHLYLAQTLQMRNLQSDGSWRESTDGDGGVTSELGFRIIVDHDERLRVVKVADGHRYVRPDEGDERVRELEAEIARLKSRLADGI